MAMRTRRRRCLILQRTLPQTIYPVSRAQRAVYKGRVRAHSVSKLDTAIPKTSNSRNCLALDSLGARGS